MRLGLVVLLLAGCAAKQPAPHLSVPTPAAGRVTVNAAAAPRIGTVQPIAVALTNGGTDPLRLDPRQVYAYGEAVERVPPLAPAEAARRSGGKGVPGALKGGAVGVASGSIFGAIGGAISGAIQGGIGSAVAAGTAVGAAIGLITGVIAGSRDTPDVAGYQERALAGTTLSQDFSAQGYVYYPEGSYSFLEILLADDRSGAVHRERVSIAPTP